MPRIVKKPFASIFTQFFIMNDFVNFEDKFLYIFIGLSNHNFPFKVCNTDWWFKDKIFR